MTLQFNIDQHLVHYEGIVLTSARNHCFSNATNAEDIAQIARTKIWLNLSNGKLLDRIEVSTGYLPDNLVKHITKCAARDFQRRENRHKNRGAFGDDILEVIERKKGVDHEIYADYQEKLAFHLDSYVEAVHCKMSKSAQRVLNCFIANPEATFAEVGASLGISDAAVSKQVTRIRNFIAKLKLAS